MTKVQPGLVPASRSLDIVSRARGFPTGLPLAFRGRRLSLRLPATPRHVWWVGGPARLPAGSMNHLSVSREMHTAIQLRHILPADAAAVSELGIRSKASWGYGPEEMAIFARELTFSGEDIPSRTDAAVAMVDGEVVGYFTLRAHPNGVTELEHLFVHPDWFHQGIGKALLQAALRAARDRGIDTITIIADPNSTGFYLKHGAVVVGEHTSSIKGRTIPVLSMPTDAFKGQQSHAEPMPEPARDIETHTFGALRDQRRD